MEALYHLFRWNGEEWKLIASYREEADALWIANRLSTETCPVEVIGW